MQGGLSGGAGGGLARFRSAPATWLDALLEDEDSLKLSGPHHPPPSSTSTANTSTTTATGGGGGGLTQLLTGGVTTASPSSALYIPDPDPGFFEGGGGGGGGGAHHQVTSSDAFQRMNSSPAEFLSGNVDGYFASYGLGPGSGYDFVGPASASTSTADHVDVDVSHGKRLRDNHHHSDQLSPSFLSHHRRGEQGGQLSATSSGLLDLEMEKLLEDSVPCRVRAKRGCATHPRSIAERVRRTRISDRIRKLQELVPNMDKQTNTADMLEEAVEYVKTLQKQIQELTELQKKCTCMAKS